MREILTKVYWEFNRVEKGSNYPEGLPHHYLCLAAKDALQPCDVLKFNCYLRKHTKILGIFKRDVHSRIFGNELNRERRNKWLIKHINKN